MVKKNLIGVHASIAGGFEKAVERGADLGCTAIQIFTKNNRQWRATPITLEQENIFKQACKNFNMQMVIAHATYLINIAACSEEILYQSKRALIEELERCEQLGIFYLVLHPGSYTQMSSEQALKQVVQTLDYVFSHAKSTGMILLENMAGQGTQLGATFQQLSQIINASKFPNRLAVCVDTCHAWAAGYDFGTQEKYNNFWQEFDQTIGLHRLQAIHLNDSKKERGSAIDRHEHIGAGLIGLSAFQYICKDIRFRHIPKILETPKKNSDDDYKNMQTIKNLL